jgi:myxalamid-type polyketide synthase MxaE and MxaD
MDQDEPQAAVMDFNLRQWRQFYPKSAASPLFADLIAEESAAEGNESAGGTALGEDDSRLAALKAAEPRERRSMLERFLRQQAAQVLRMPVSRIQVDAPLRAVGFDSLMGVEFRNRIEANLGLTLSATLVWKYPTIAALAVHLISQLGGEADATPAPAAALSEACPTPADVKSLSDEELVARLTSSMAAVRGS